MTNDNSKPGEPGPEHSADGECPICKAKSEIGTMLHAQIIETLRGLIAECMADLAAGKQSEDENADDRITVAACAEMLLDMGVGPVAPQQAGGLVH